MASTPSPAVVTQPLHSHADALLSGAAPPEADLIRPFTPEEEPGIGGELAKNSSETPAVHAPSHASGAADVVQLPSWHDDDNPGGDGGRQHDAKHNMSAHAASGMLASSPLASVARVSKTLLARELPSTSEGGNQPRSGWSLGSLANKTTVRSILNARDGLRGIATEVPADGPGCSSAQSARSGPGSSRGSEIAQNSSNPPEMPQTLRLRRGKRFTDLQVSDRPPPENGNGEEQNDQAMEPDGQFAGSQRAGLQREASLSASFISRKKGWLWADYNDLPDLPSRNIFGMSLQNKLRQKAVRVAINSRLELFWMILALVHFLIGMPEIQDNVFGCTMLRNQGDKYKTCKYTIPNWHHVLFLFLYTVEAAIKIIGFGLMGGKFSWWTHDQYNKLDIIAYAAYWYETVSVMIMGSTSMFSLRGFRLMRLLKPLGKIGVFSELETIFHAFGQAMMPMATVLMFIWFVLILFGIMGMALWGQNASFRRRCIWADTLEIKEPEQYCSRIEKYHEYPNCQTQLFLPLVNETNCERNPNKVSERRGTLAGDDRQPAGLDNNCGPFQLCLDVANPNNGFTSFDHLPAALVTLFQVLSGDGDVLVFGYALEADPAQALFAQFYFIGYTFLVIHVLINVFVAVFANIFADVRSEHEEIVEMRRAGITRGSGSSDSGSDGNSSSLGSGSHPPSSQVEVAEVDSPRKTNEETAIERQLRNVERTRQEEIQRQKHSEGTPAWVKQKLESRINPSLQIWMQQYFRENDIWPTLSISVVLVQGVGLALIGVLCDERNCYIDRILEDMITNFNIFFTVDQVIQILCDGSIAKHFETGEHIFNIIITTITTCGLVLRLLGLAPTTVAVFRGFAIFRLLRVCKIQVLQPIWLMLVKTMGSIMSVMNLCLFNTLVAIVYYSLGRSLFQEALTDNFYFNYSSLSRGYMLLLTVMTGDSWSSFMYEAMATFCTGDQAEDTCDNFSVVMTCLYYMLWFFYGQFLFVTMFLAIILESFAVEEFMSKVEAEDEEKYLEKQAAIEAVAEFQKVPTRSVSTGLIKIAFLKLADGGTEVAESKLITLVRMVQPMTAWRLAKASGLIALRQFLRNTVCACLAESSLLKPYPGDKDYTYIEPVVVQQKTEEEAEIEVATQWQRQIKEYMRQLVAGGLLGEVMVVAKITGIFAHINLQDLVNIEPVLALKLLRYGSISRALGLNGMFENLIQESMSSSGQPKLNGVTLEGEDYKGLDLSTLDDQGAKTKIDFRNDSKMAVLMKRARKFSFKLVHNPAFESTMFCLILVSSVFLCLETPHPTLPGVVPEASLRLADLFFNVAFTVEFLAKVMSFGFYRPLSVQYMSYLQVTQNRIDLFILFMGWADQVPGASEYIGQSTTKIVRLMKVMRPVRLLLRSEGLKQIIDALVASLKPMFYATLFLIIVCILFSVTGMAFFKHKFFSCSDLSLDGTMNEGKLQCTGSYYVEESGYMAPRSWIKPRTGSNFDSLASSFFLLFKCLTLNWVGLYELAQDTVEVDVQPVPGYSMVQASLYFHIFILFGSFFGLNLFASFMCDTFYSLQGTAQLEEVQWMAVQKMLQSHQPKKHRAPPKNVVSTFLRQVLGSSVWQNLSAFCLLLNVTFMGSMHSSQDVYFDNFMDDQNTVFFGIMCGEAGLHLISLGPILYILSRPNQFDLFLISATAATMIFDESLRSFSQVTRILRLFKFLRALAKDKTISNTFETVLVSMGQVVNILIILMVLLVMLSVLAVQLFGLVRPGNRLGKQANFSSFDQSFKTVFQLMFGEDFPALMDDCSITIDESYSCTDTIYAEDGETIVHMSDCGTAHAYWFFFIVLVLTNYVMLNLFVGMIMNNFAYISTKDGNGAVEDEHFVDAAFKYVQHLDPALKGQVPIEQVYQFFNMIGPPLGNYGTSKNWGRFLCVREELKRIMSISQEDEKGKFYLKYYQPVLEKEEYLKDMNLARWKRMKAEVTDFENQYRKACDGNADELKRMGLALDDGEHEGEDEHDEQQGHAVISENHPEEAAETTGNREGEDAAPPEGNLVHTSGTAFGGRMSTSLAAQSDSQRGDSIRPFALSSASCAMVSGGNMGAGGAIARVPARKKTIKRNKSTFDPYEAQLVAAKGKSPLEIEMERLQVVQELEEKLTDARAKSIKEPEPRPTMQLRFLSVLLHFLRFFLSDKERNLRRPGHVRYSEIILALLYWNKERNIVPKKLMEKRKEKDDLIQYDVAFQMISGVCYGGIVRRRMKLSKQAAKDRLRRAQRTIAGGRDMTIRVSKDQQAKVRRAKSAPAQDEAAKMSLKVWADDPETGPLKTLCCQVAKYELRTGSQLADIAEDCGFVVKADGIFQLQESELKEILDQSKELEALFDHVKLIESIKTFIQEVSEFAPAYLKLAAKTYDIPIGDQFENLATVPVSDLKRLLADPYVMTILPSSMFGGRSSPAFAQQAGPDEDRSDPEFEFDITEEELRKQERREQKRRELEQELRALKDKQQEEEQRAVELNLIIEYTQRRAITMESDIEHRRGQNRRAVAEKKRRAGQHSVLANNRSSTLPQVKESQSELLQLSEDEEGCEEHKWWEAPAVGWATTSSDTPLLVDNVVDQVQSIHILPSDGDDGSGLSQRCRIASTTSTKRPETAPLASSLPGHSPGDDWLDSELDSSGRWNCTGMLEESIAGTSPRHRPFTAPDHLESGPDTSIAKLEESMQIAKAEIDRLERMRTAGVREQARHKKERLALLHQQSTSDEAAGQARIRRDQKHQHEADSESTTSGLLSPRDKPTRKEVLRREEARKQRAAEERTGGQSRGSSRASSRQGSRQGSRTLGGSVGITF